MTSSSIPRCIYSFVPLPLLQPLSRADATGTYVRVLWLNEGGEVSARVAGTLELLQRIPGSQLVSAHWEQLRKDPIQLVATFEAIQVVLVFSDHNRDGSIWTCAASMARAVVTDNKEQDWVIHGETGIVSHTEPHHIVQSIAYLRESPVWRAELGRALRYKLDRTIER